MAIVKLGNLVRMTVSGNPGTGTVTVGAAVAGFITFNSAGISSGDTITYAIKDGDNREVGRGVYTFPGDTITRDTVLSSTNGGAKINVTSAAVLSVVAAAEDIMPQRNFGGVGRITWGQILSAPQYGAMWLHQAPDDSNFVFLQDSTGTDPNVYSATLAGGFWSFQHGSTVSWRMGIESTIAYLNASGVGATGYGIRNNAGTIQWKNLSGAWVNIPSAYSHPNHTGDVTSAGDGAQTIVANAVTNTKLADMGANTIKGSVAGGDPADLTAAQVRTLLGLAASGGSIKIGNVIINWGTMQVNTTGVSATFSQSYTANPFVVATALTNIACRIVSVSTTQVNINVSSGTPFVNWIAIGV